MFKGDIQATRSTAAAGAAAIISQPVRLKGIIVLVMVMEQVF